jgi:hypothetical protein
LQGFQSLSKALHQHAAAGKFWTFKVQEITPVHSFSMI